MCDVLQIPRTTYYYEAKAKPDESELTALIVDIFIASRTNYVTRKIKVKLKERNIIASHRRIGRIMKHEGLVSNYTTAQFHS
jgi:transposase InsO family protein